MSVNTFDIEGVTTNTGPWILACEYCYWTSLDIDIEFQKPNNVYTQLAKLHSDGSHQTPLRREVVVDQSDETLQGRDPDLQFGSLKSFYTSQLAKTTTTNPLMSPSGEFNYNSPSSLARIISLYTGQGSYGKKSIGKTIIMRESADASEGLAIFDKKSEEAEVASLLKKGWQGTTCVAQQIEQVHQHRFVRNLRPIPTLLRTKRSKRCRTCRHILVKPETKVQNTRYRIRLVAINYIPTMTLKPLQLADPSSALPSIKLDALTPSRASQLLLTMKNPMFDPVQITLATPSQTPGRFSSKVTILCPEFDIGPNTDVWDEALNSTTSESRTSIKHARTKAEAGESEARVAEAGKIWEKGRNWTTVVVEVVPAMIGHDEVREDELDEDEDVLEIPVFVRMEYEGDAAGDDAGGARESKEKKEKREVSFWCVLGVGRIAR
ncbi:hypothetical protein MMC14_004465 [Varicellaria rhodocarpa]|nr:hypothetical protein [Varicellaria rhodocarpa]